MYDPIKTEQEILEFWKKNNVYLKNKEKNKEKKPFYFLQGPPYTNARIHIGQAWNNSMKDSVLRYKRMKGFDVWDRAGWDMHGLPIEAKAQKKLNLTFKEDIEKFGIDKFIEECRKLSSEFANLMSKDLTNLGVWLDYENAYMPIKEEWINSAWFLVKKANEKNRLYQGEKTITWDPVTETALAKHECEYKKVKDNSIFVKFKIRNSNKYLLVWTTTPWTLAFNLAIMVNPKLDYVEAEVEGETWILAKELTDKVIKDNLDKKYVIKEEFKGDKLKGMSYEHPWENEIPEFTKLKLKYPKVHTVVLSKEYVNLEAGTGLVHTAPGCGPEDYEVGYENKIPPFNNIDEKGVFPDSMGCFSGLIAKKDDEKFIKKLKENGNLVGILEYEHEYPFGARSKQPVIFRTTKQWFFKIEDLKQKMLDFNREVHWVPEKAKNAFNSWLENLRDNSITRQRYWGIPVPIWKCDKCDKYTVVESKDELVKLSGQEPKDLHKPWIDEIKIKCECGSDQKRIPDVLDVWIDAGIGSYACLYYPQRKDFFERYFPPDLIIEGKDQIRGWFNLLMISAILALDKIPFKNVYMHGFVTDVHGEKMSKSLGNIIPPTEVIEKHGADTLRLYMSQSNAGEDINFSWDELKNKYKTLTILWNIHQYLLDYLRANNINPEDIPEEIELEEKYILSKLNSTIRDVTELYEFYNIDKVPGKIEELILSLSREYIQLTREKIHENPQLVLSTIYYSLLELLKMFSTVCPFISEKIYQNLKLPFNLDKESISLEEWPKYNSRYIDQDLEKQFAITQHIIQAGLSAREKAKQGVRWPLQKVTILSNSKEIKGTINQFKELIKSKLNIKEIDLKEEFKFEDIEIIPNKTTIGRDFKKDSPDILKKLTKENLKEFYEKKETKVNGFSLSNEHFLIKEKISEGLTYSEFKQGKLILDTNITKELEQEGFSRELIRKIQDLRKDKGLKKNDLINLSITSNYNIIKFKEYIQEKVGASVLDFTNKNYENKKNIEIKGKNFKISFIKL